MTFKLDIEAHLYKSDDEYLIDEKDTLGDFCNMFMLELYYSNTLF